MQLLRSDRPLPWRTKLGYGSAELGIVSVEVLIELYLLKFYNVVVGLPPLYTALALAVAIVWDAVSDPIMGEISDRTRHPAGKRRPFIVPGAVALALTFVVIYNPPPMDSLTFKFLFLLVSYLCLTTAMTVVSVPHIALGGEMSFDRNERTQIFGYRRLFTTAGLLLGTLLPALVLRALGNESDPEVVARSRSITSVLLVVPIVLTAWMTVRSTRGLDQAASMRESQGVLNLGRLHRDQLSVLRTRVFLPLLLAFIVAGVGRAVNASMALYYYEYRLRIPESVTVLRILMPFFLCIVISVPFWIWVSRRLGKKWPALFGAGGLGVMVGVGYLSLPPGQLLGPTILAIVGGFLSGSLILLESLVADVVDYDELKTGLHREGLFFGMWKMSTKLSRAVGLFLAGSMLGLIGFDESAAVQAPAVTERLAWLFGPGVGSLLVLGAAIFAFMPLTDARHRRVQALLRRRRARSGVAKVVAAD